MDQPIVYVTEIAELFPQQGMWTEADYLRLPHDRRVIELTGGRLTVYPIPSPEHQRLAGDLAIALDRYVVERRLGEVLFASVVVRLGLNHLRMPDLIFLRSQHASRKHKLWIEGPPDWIAEVLSPETQPHDEEKLADYARAAVPETWLVDPAARSIRVYVLSADLPEYFLAASYVPGDIARAETIPGFEIAVEGLF
jgi:Uma2 family endonuclease